MIVRNNLITEEHCLHYAAVIRLQICINNLVIKIISIKKCVLENKHNDRSPGETDQLLLAHIANFIIL